MHDIVFFNFLIIFSAGWLLDLSKYLLWEKYYHYLLSADNGDQITMQGDRFASCENIVSRSQTSSLPSPANTYSYNHSSSETQGHSVGSGEKAGRKFSSTGKRAPGYRLSPSYFQKFKRMPAPDWAHKMLCIIVPNRRTVSPEFFS